MNTINFLLDYLSLNAPITITNTKGEIMYTGNVENVPLYVVKGTVIESIDGLGTLNDIFISIKNK